MDHIVRWVSFHLWAVVWACLAVSCLVMPRFSRRTVVTYAWLTLFSVFCSLALAEVFLSLKQHDTFYVFDAAHPAAEAGLIPCNTNVEPDPVLGYGPSPRPVRMHCLKKDGDDVVYDAVYATLDTGWRMTPQRGEAAGKGVLFFGCSFTYGEGLADAETFPYRLGELLGQDYQVFNFGLSGYGAHQMLAQIESGRLDPLFARYPDMHVYFLTIEQHVERSAGYTPWDQNSHRYVLENGRLADTGRFSDHVSAVKRLADKLFAKSFLYDRLCNRPSAAERPAMTALHLAILERCDRLLREKYGQRLTVLLWPGAESFRDPLDRAGLATVDLAPLFPDYRDKADPYRIRNDGHPNALAAQRIADLLAERIRAEAAAGK